MVNPCHSFYTRSLSVHRFLPKQKYKKKKSLGDMNPWYFMYQPVSYKLDGRMGRREELQKMINTCRQQGVRVYNDLVLNHFTGAGNDLLNHRNPNAGRKTIKIINFLNVPVLKPVRFPYSIRKSAIVYLKTISSLNCPHI